jgi:hypothetical protein
VHWAKLDDGSRFLNFFYQEKGGIVASLLISPDWSKIDVYWLYVNSYASFMLNPVIAILFNNICLFHKGIALHAAAIEYNGGAIAFSAPSETGKSTQADLWVKHFGAEYINSDRPLLRFIDDELCVCGTAWSGLSPVYTNKRVPLDTLVFLEQHSENIIEKLDPVEALKKMLPRCFLPYQDRDMMELAMDNIEAVVLRADCYLLKCTPELAAAELVRDAIQKK